MESQVKIKNYSVKEASEKLGIKVRAIQNRCKKNDLRKKDNRYLITQDHIDQWLKEIKANAPTNAPMHAPNDQIRINKLLNEIDKLQTTVVGLKNELSQYDILDNERLEVFTFDDYEIFKERLIQWRLQRKEIELKDKHFEAEIKSADERTTHYKNQYYYQRQLASKQLQQIEKLINSIGKQLQHTTERNYIEARDKNILDANTGKPKF